MRKFLLFFLLITPLLATEMNCNPSAPSSELAPGGTKTFTLSCTLNSQEYNETYHLILDRRDEWFYQVETPEGPKNITELYPATQHLTDLDAPDKVTEGEEFSVDIEMKLPASYSYSETQVKGRVDLVTDFGNQTHIEPIIITLTQSQEEEPPSDPLGDIIDTVNDVLGGDDNGGGGGGGPMGGGMPTGEPTQDSEQDLGEPQLVTPSKPEETSNQEEQAPTQQGEVRITMPTYIKQTFGITDLTLNYALLSLGGIITLAGLLIYLKIG